MYLIGMWFSANERKKIPKDTCVKENKQKP